MQSARPGLTARDALPFGAMAAVGMGVAIHMVRKSSPPLFISALAGGAAIDLGEAVAFRPMPPDASN